MTLNEAIKHIEKVAEENQRIVDTGILFDNVTIDMFYCDDTEAIEEHLANYQKCAERHRQFAEWLKELKQLREQTRWIPCSEKLPDEEKWVIGYINNIHDGIGAPNMCVVKIEKGISKKEREMLKKLKDPRANLFYNCDEYGNNLVPYAWNTWGPGKYFGQEIVAWREAPESYKAESEE